MRSYIRLLPYGGLDWRLMRGNSLDLLCHQMSATSGDENIEFRPKYAPQVQYIEGSSSALKQKMIAHDVAIR